MNQLIFNQFLIQQGKTLSMWNFETDLPLESGEDSKNVVTMKSYEETHTGYGKSYFQYVS